MRTLIICLSLMSVLILSGCSHTREFSREVMPGNETGVDYSLIYYIHADGDYLYHTAEGKPVRQNSEVLISALERGEEARSGEVFIFHQRPEKKLFGIFSRKSSRFYHFKNGNQINRVKYRHRDKKESFLSTEALLLHQARAQKQTDIHQNLFLYFGHEIPLENGRLYHRSLPGIEVNSASFTNGIQRFLGSNEDRYKLVVLSTCNNGTPEMAELLMPFTDVMLASPQNLHLSHIDPKSLDLLENNPGFSPLQLAKSMAGQTFTQLKEQVETTITLAVYDFKVVETYIDKLHAFTKSYSSLGYTQAFSDNIDCKQSGFFETEFTNGVDVWFKPAKFGRKIETTAHSGWGCKPFIENRSKI